MNPLAALEFVDRHALTFAIGSTLVLGIGLSVMRFTREPIARRRIGIQTALACAIYLALAVLPLPRFGVAHAMGLAPGVGSSIEAIPRASAATPVLEAAASRAPSPPPPARSDAASEPSQATPAAVPQPWLGHAWALGVVLGGLRLLLGAARLRRVLARSRPAPASLRQNLAPGTRTRILVDPRAGRPFCCGVFRTWIVIPADWLRPPRESSLRAVLRHEAAHLAQRDPLVQLGFAVLLPLMAWHPLLLRLARDVRFAGELLADDAAARGAAPSEYVRALLDAADAGAPLVAHAGLVPLFRRRSEFIERMQMLLQRENRLARSTSRVQRWLSTALLATVGAIGVGGFGVEARAQEAEAPRVEVLVAANERLRGEVAALQRELAALRAALDKGAPGQRALPEPPPAAGSEPRSTPDRESPARPDGELAALVELVTRYVEVDLELKLAEAAHVEQSALSRAGRIDERTGREAEMRLAAARQKRALLRQIVEAESESTGRELARVTALASKGLATLSELRRVEARAKVLRSTLDG
ncbi:MAG: hypothetical protein IT457_04460 [Planctomycetes bacterium]|nr:hypothetical protein [Planctomycetota bacterium]